MFSWLLSILLSLGIISGTTSETNTPPRKGGQTQTTVGSVSTAPTGPEKTIVIGDFVVK